MELFGKFLSVITYDASGAWKNPQLNRLISELKTRQISLGDLDSLHSLGVLSIQTTTNRNVGTYCKVTVEELTLNEKAYYERSNLFGEHYHKKSP